MRFVVIGNIGSDAGYWYWDEHGLHHVGGWGIEQLLEVKAALNIIREATNFKTPGLAEAATRTVAEFAQKQLTAHLKDVGKEGGGVVIIA